MEQHEEFLCKRHLDETVSPETGRLRVVHDSGKDVE